jgi:hypothetical protein
VGGAGCSCADSPLTTAQFYSAGFTEDMREVVRLQRSRYPTAPLMAVSTPTRTQYDKARLCMRAQPNESRGKVAGTSPHIVQQEVLQHTVY